MSDDGFRELGSGASGNLEGLSLRNIRRDEMTALEAPPSVVISTELMEQRMQAIHCRLLERATGGRLTFDGDRIVPKRNRYQATGDLVNLPSASNLTPQPTATAPRRRGRPRKLLTPLPRLPAPQHQ